ncbi:MAG TPA: periplasmic heavy metal sensor [Steroidobacteraceae bacterium]|jgi:Spy/CpxP family protein refolding chaperone
MKWQNAIAAGLLCLALAAPAGAAGPDGKDEWIKGKLFGPELILQNRKELKLTPKQLELIGAELKRVQAQAADSDWTLMTEASQLQELIDQHPVDGKAVMAGVDRVFAAENRKKRLFMEMLVNVKNALTPEQVAYLQSVDKAP